MYNQFIMKSSSFDCAISREKSVGGLCHKMSAYVNKKFITPMAAVIIKILLFFSGLVITTAF